MTQKEQTSNKKATKPGQQTRRFAPENLNLFVLPNSRLATHPLSIWDKSVGSNRNRMLQFQQTIGNQAAQRYLPATMYSLKGVSTKSRLSNESAAIQKQSQVANAESPPIVVTDGDRTEFEHLQVRTGRANNTSFANVEDYVIYRNNYFGSQANYDVIQRIADAEWDEHAAIRSNVGQAGDSADRRKALYRWLRLEYRRAGIDTAPEIAALMRQGMTSELQAIIARVRELHPALQTGGFVARPKKHENVGYRLGTLSEHATGRAFDIRPQSDNPQIPLSAWQVIERLAGRQVDRSLQRWRDTPAELWQDVYDLNQEYADAVVREVDEIRARREMAGKNPDRPNPLLRVLAVSAWLRRRATQQGLSFFTLTEDLVLAMHREGLTWGITFRTPDLHHFELP